ncbi:GDSL family lipase [Mucilaginibacter mali]|uniref:GDSL family lipase n=1 Tax=Mucilaginibacter mali TaxID=2740462 RepID=A0A7D4TKM3_9SPHI|nr:GDSL-type esterase/lipase family protein [Mucilaginibacter mali]QKJ28833.1 GDSL family lipase [Mucilaginibacter mali]
MFWYEDEVRRLESKINQSKNRPVTLFYGSSSFRLWPDLENDFAAFDPVNLGFGGSTLAACTWFFNRTVAPYNPRAIVIYAGDNDLGDGRHPEEIFIYFQQLAVLIKDRFGDIPCFFISIKPSLARWDLIDALKYTNNIIESEIIRQDENWSFINIFQLMLKKDGRPNEIYFEKDGLHLTKAGYTLWKSVIEVKLSSILHPGLT